MAKKPQSATNGQPAEETRKPGRPRRERPNVTNVNPDDIVACYSEYASMRGDIARIGQKIAAMFGRYEKQGVQAKGIKNAYAMAAKDPEMAAAQHRMQTEYLAILQIISFDKDGQGSFAAGLEVVTPKPSGAASQKLLLAKVNMDGYNSGLAGGRKDACRYEPGTQEHVLWLEAFEDGARDRLAKNPDAAKTVQASTSRKRREPEAPSDAVH